MSTSDLANPLQSHPPPSATAPAVAGHHGKLHRSLSPFAVLLIALSCLSPVFSLIGVGGDVLTHAGTGAALLFLLGIAAAAVWAMVYAELGSAYPYAGGDYVGVGCILGSWAGVMTLALWLVTGGPNIALMAQTVAVYAAQLVPGLPVPAVTFGTIAAATALALLAVRTSALITGLFLAVEMLAVVLLAVAGVLHPARGVASVLLHPVVLNAAGGLSPAPLGAMALAGISAAYATVGGNQAIAFGEELRDPHRTMGNVVVMACMSGAFATALPVVAVVLGTRDLRHILHSPAPFAAFLSDVLGGWAGAALSACVALAIFNAAIASVMFFARLLFSMGRDEMLPQTASRFLARVHSGSGVPRAATSAVGVFSAACCLLSSHVNVMIISGLLVYAWPVLCAAVLVGRRKGLTGAAGYWASPLFPAAPVAGLVMAAVFIVADLADAEAGRPSMIILGAVVSAALAWERFVLRKRPGGWTPKLIASEPGRR